MAQWDLSDLVVSIASSIPLGGIQLAEQGSCFLSIFKLIWV